MYSQHSITWGLVCAIACVAPCRAQIPRVYWSEQSGVVESIATNGTGFLSFDVPGTENFGLAIHGSRRELYVVTLAPDSFYTIYRMGLDGSNPTQVIRNDGLHVAVDITNDKLYWETSSHIMRAELDGSNVEQVVARFRPGFLKREDNLAVDGIHGYVYWTENGHPYRSGLNGQNPEVLFGITEPEILLTGIAASPTDGSVCFSWSSHEGVFFESGAISCYRHDGQQLFSINPVDPFAPAFLPVHLTVGRGNQVIWHNDWWSTIQRLGPPSPEGSQTALTLYDTNGFVWGMAIDDYVIPEPSTAILTLAAATLAALRRRTRSARRAFAP